MWWWQERLSRFDQIVVEIEECTKIQALNTTYKLGLCRSCPEKVKGKCSNH